MYVGCGTRTRLGDAGGVVQQQLSVSDDGGRTFGAPISLGPLSVLTYAARSRGYFPGDYTGSSLAGNRLHVLWARSCALPPGSASPFHQVIEGRDPAAVAVSRTAGAGRRGPAAAWRGRWRPG